jgi:ferrous iron transport protein B
MKKILLIGNPNVGKSVVFNRLTGASVLASNYPGTTIEYTSGRMRIGDERAEIIDVPGTYSLEPTSPAEEVATKMVDEGDVIISVLDATNIERSLNLALQILKRRKPTIVALNFWDETKHTGVDIDVKKLEETLGVPCVPTTAITGQGIKNLVERIPEAKVSAYDFEDAERWHEVGNIVEAVQTVTHKHHTFLEWLGDLSVRPLSGIPIALLVMAGMFYVIRELGEAIVGLFEAYVFDGGFWGAWMAKLSEVLGGEGFIHNILIGRLIKGEIDFGQSFGLLTTGLQVPIGAVFPYVLAFYLVLSFIEDCGYLPRLAVLMDTLMHRLGLHGMSIVPMLLGMGCNVPGVLAARIMESRRQRFIAVLLMVIGIPCMAQTAIIISLVKGHSWLAFPMIFGTLFVVWLALGFIFKYTIRGESPEILIDIPPYRIPYFRGLFKKLWIRMVWFFREAVPWVLLGVLIVNILDTLGVIDFLGEIAKPVVSGVLGLPENAVGALIIGFLRKDVAVGMLQPLALSFSQVVVACVVLTMYFPCVATFAVMFKEFGLKDMLKAALIMVIASITVGGLLNLVLSMII